MRFECPEGASVSRAPAADVERLSRLVRVREETHVVEPGPWLRLTFWAAANRAGEKPVCGMCMSECAIVVVHVLYVNKVLYASCVRLP